MMSIKYEAIQGYFVETSPKHFVGGNISSRSSVLVRKEKQKLSG